MIFVSCVVEGRRMSEVAHSASELPLSEHSLEGLTKRLLVLRAEIDSLLLSLAQAAAAVAASTAPSTTATGDAEPMEAQVAVVIGGDTTAIEGTPTWEQGNVAVREESQPVPSKLANCDERPSPVGAQLVGPTASHSLRPIHPTIGDAIVVSFLQARQRSHKGAIAGPARPRSGQHLAAKIAVAIFALLTAASVMTNRTALSSISPVAWTLTSPSLTISHNVI
jgi:hypothetical protein